MTSRAGDQFDSICVGLALNRIAAKRRDPDFWRKLVPGLKISMAPLDLDPAFAGPSDEQARRAAEQLDSSGYFRVDGVVPRQLCEQLQSAIQVITATGLPAIFCFLYDDFWTVFARMQRLMQSLLGPDYVLAGHGLWGFHIRPGERSLSRWGAAPPHRDSLGPDAAVIAHRPPRMINFWLPLTAATLDNSCIYVIPSAGDPDYRTERRSVDPARLELQRARALPAAPGDVLGWSTHLVHWGAAASVNVADPRISVALYAVDRSVASQACSPVEIDAPLGFERRLEMIEASLGLDAAIWDQGSVSGVATSTDLAEG